ncbi:hypothetical protein RQP46_001965 [Phenoliferia psychrophenolica]
MAPTPIQTESKPRSSRDDVLSFLDSLDSYSTPTPSKAAPGSPSSAAQTTAGTPAGAPSPASGGAPPVASAEEAQSVLDFLDEITQRSSTPTATVKAADPQHLLAKKSSHPAGLSRSTSKSNLGASTGPGASRRSGESTRSRTSTDSPGPGESSRAEQQQQQQAAPAEGGWGWSSVWSQASSVVQQASVIAQQARNVAEEQVKTASTNAAGLAGGIEGIRGGVMKALGENEQAKKWSEGVIEYARGAHLDQLGKDLKSQTLRSLTDLLNAVAPPIADHEVIEVSLSHDMVGYDGIESLVYRGLSTIMDQIEGGTLVINKGEERKPKETESDDPDERNLNTVDGLAEGWKLAEADLEELIKKSFKPEPEVDAESSSAESVTVPVTTCPIYLRIQPCLAPQPYAAIVRAAATGDDAAAPAVEDKALFFLLVLRDPTHKLVHTSLSQSMPAEWLDIPFEENEWVEDVMVDVIGRSVQVVGKAYLHSRMTAQSVAISKARDAAKLTLESLPPVEAPALSEEAQDAINQAAATSRIVGVAQRKSMADDPVEVAAPAATDSPHEASGSFAGGGAPSSAVDPRDAATTAAPRTLVDDPERPSAESEPFKPVDLADGGASPPRIDIDPAPLTTPAADSALPPLTTPSAEPAAAPESSLDFEPTPTMPTSSSEPGDGGPAHEQPTRADATPGATPLAELTSTITLEGLSHPVPAASALAAAPALLEQSTAPLVSSVASSATSNTPTPGAALLPAPTPSGSPAPAAKKFHSSLSVNKKFLEKAGEKSKPDVKATVARLATPPIVVPVSTSHPRLLTGKISAGTSISLTTAQTVSGVSGWLKNTAAAGADGAVRPPLPTQQDAAGLGRGGTYERGRGGMMPGLGRGSGAAVWGSKSAGGGNLNMGIGGDFPTAAEAANAKTLRAAALLEQMQSKDRAIQARAAAQAAANAHLLEGLDAFRGVHLDPNASHWDDDGEDTDFLDDTIEFGDGTQYKIEDLTPAPNSSHVQEPSPADFATREAPLAPGEGAAHEGGQREERFKDDFDRSWPKRPVANDPKSIFNERLGKFEAAPKKGAPPALEEPSRPARARAPSGSEHSNASVTSPRIVNASLPPLSGRPAGAWGRRPSMEQQPRGRRPSNEPVMARRPSIEQGGPGGRQLPPHLLVAPSAAPLPPRGHDRPAGPPPAHHSAPPSHAYPPLSPAAVLSPPHQPKLPLPSSHEPVAPAPAPAPAAPVAPAPPVVDLEELHTREMHAAAERAKKRRQEEEDRRLEQVERAKKKAAELEEKLRLAAEAKAAEAAANAPPPPPQSQPVAKAPPTSSASTWRTAKPVAPAPVVAAPTSHPAATSKPEPTSILSREPKPPANADRPAAPPPFSRKTSAGAVPPTEDRVWRRGDAIPAGLHPSEPSRSSSSRQLPPHLQPAATAQTSAPAPPAPSQPAQSTPQPKEATPPSPVEAAAPTSPAAVDVAAPVLPASEPASAQITRKASTGSVTGPPSAAKGAFKKVPQISTFEDTMSRIKTAMAVPKDPSADSVDAARPAALIPTVKLPTTTLSLATATVSSAGHRSASSEAKPAAKAPRTNAKENAKDIPTAPRGRPDKKAAHAPPAFDNREPMLPFDCTRVERSLSPAPAWKVYPVRLAAYPKMSIPHHKALKGFFNPHEPGRVHIVCTPAPQQNSGRGRGPNLFPPTYVKNKITYPVTLQANRIVRRTSIEMLPVSLFAPPPPKAVEPRPSRAPEGSWRREGTPNGGESPSIPEESAAAVQELEDHLDATTAPEASSLFDLGPARPRQGVKDKVPPGESIAFYRPPAVPPLERAGSSQMFMVTSELNGEVVEKSPRESLAAPGADAAVQVSELDTTSTPPVESPPSSSQALSPPSNGAWPSKTPLTMSVLDPTAPSVWSAPPTDSPVHARVASLGGIQPENSLQGIADPDDFPAASIPTSLAELKSEDEGSSDGRKPVIQKMAAKDEARLRAAAPSFSSYNELPSPHVEQRSLRYPTFQRTPSYPQLQPSQSPVNYGQPFLPQNQGYVPPPQSHLYPNFAPPSTQSAGSPYGAPMHPGFGPSSFAPPPLASSPQFSNYRVPNPNNTITNPALIAQGFGPGPSYGPIGASAFGPVGGSGAGGSRNGSGAFAHRSPSMAPNYLSGSYGNVNGAQVPHPYAQQQQQQAAVALLSSFDQTPRHKLTMFDAFITLISNTLFYTGFSPEPTSELALFCCILVAGGAIWLAVSLCVSCLESKRDYFIETGDSVCSALRMIPILRSLDLSLGWVIDVGAPALFYGIQDLREILLSGAKAVCRNCFFTILRIRDSIQAIFFFLPHHWERNDEEAFVQDTQVNPNFAMHIVDLPPSPVIFAESDFDIARRRSLEAQRARQRLQKKMADEAIQYRLD